MHLQYIVTLAIYTPSTALYNAQANYKGDPYGLLLHSNDHSNCSFIYSITDFNTARPI